MGDERFANSPKCPVPLRGYSQIVMAHGGGGKLTSDLVDDLFRPAFANPLLDSLRDSACLSGVSGRVAFTTDSYVVRPLLFPGGTIGDLAVNGTVNDLAMSGAEPMWLSASFILEEGLDIDTLRTIVASMSSAAKRANVAIVCGDTKVVERGHGDGCYITTSGIGQIANGVDIGPEKSRPGDAILLSGPIGNHGMTIVSAREGIGFESDLRSDTASLWNLVRSILAVCPDVRSLRDPTRGGLAASLNEIARCSQVGMLIEEASVPVDAPVRSACELLGLDPLLVANEGKLVAIVPSQLEEVVLKAMRGVAEGQQAVRIGYVTSRGESSVVVRTLLGGQRTVPMPLGEQLPRIC